VWLAGTRYSRNESVNLANKIKWNDTANIRNKFLAGTVIVPVTLTQYIENNKAIVLFDRNYSLG